ncbi:MAG: YkgJ family cysteine cluster protein [Nitrospirae bacterium]|nr:MAG: YkgJ family cysteine cluster protein [Nitrospirota bacterium]
MEAMQDLDVSKHLETLYGVYDEIERAYNEAADFYGFSCQGCEENCCTTVFYHHTLIEYFAVIDGFDSLPEDLKEEAQKRAKDYVRELNKFRGKESLVKMYCPLNFDGLCKIYKHRPLICRIHGLPGFFKHPTRGIQQFGGCKRFERLHKSSREKMIDRTKFYTQIATLESQLRRDMNYVIRFQKTIAEMINDRILL